MSVRRGLVLACLISVLHGLFFIWYQRPDWYAEWSDQAGYRRLGQVLADTGRFTRFPESPELVPEVIRTPAYPLFVAAVYRLFGKGQLPIALVQTALFVAICAIVFVTARLIVREQLALAAAFLTALYAPLPYFGALVMTEVWTTAWLTVTMYFTIRALRDRKTMTFVLLGVAIAVTALSRPAFVLLPFALAAAPGVAVAVAATRWTTTGPAIAGQPSDRPSLGRWAIAIAAFALTMAPWFAYNYLTLGTFSLSPAGGVGRGVWEGSWQAMWPGRVQDRLTRTANEIDDRREMDRRVEAIARQTGFPPGPMLEYVHQWIDTRRIWTEPADPKARVTARIRADREYLRVGLQNLRAQTLGHLAKRVVRGALILWIGEIPVRYSDINRLRPAVIELCWSLQAILVLLAAYGIIALARGGHVAQAGALAAPILYVTAVHVPLLTEARQSLPAMPTVLLLATIGGEAVWRGSRSLALKPQVHEREHL